MEPKVHYGVHSNTPNSRSCVIFHNKLVYYSEELLVPRQTSKLEDHHSSAICNCLFNVFASILHIWKPSPPSTTRGRTMPRWQF